jgi:hypothetical protein
MPAGLNDTVFLWLNGDPKKGRAFRCRLKPAVLGA